jgi:hypothetical protein
MHFFELPESAFRFLLRAPRERREAPDIRGVAGFGDAANHQVV